MDRPLPFPRNTFRARVKRNVLTALALFALVFAIGALPIVLIYFWQASERPDAASSGAPAPAVMGPLRTVAFVNVNVVGMESEQVIAGQTVIVKEGIIAQMGPAESVKAPASALRIDGSGKYLMPGLADMHVHFQANQQDNLALLQLFVANGVTTVLNLRGTPMHLELRRRVAQGEALGPAIYTVGPYVNEPFVTTPEEVERAVVEQKRAGYDFLKLHGDLSREAYAALFRAARREGIRVVGHAPRNLGIEAMFEEKQYAVVHAEEYIYDKNNSSRGFAAIEPKIPALAEATARAGTWVIPNLTAYKNIAMQVANVEAVYSRPEMKYVPPRIAFYWSPANNPYVRQFGRGSSEAFLARYRVLEKLVKGFRDAGVRILAGTDAMNPSVVPGFSIHDELAELVRAGLTPYEAMRAATASPAEFVGSDDFGTVSIGRRGDLLLLNGDPLKDVANARNPEGVMVRGRWLSRDDIRLMLSNLAASSGRRD